MPSQPQVSSLPNADDNLLRGSEWRLILGEHHGAAWNMAVDEAILDAVAMQLAPPTLRLYGWAEEAISIGRFQNAERDIDLTASREAGVPIVRRPTGGRAVLHGEDATLSVVVPVRLLGSAGPSVAASYRLLSRGVGEALRLLGIETAMGECEKRGDRPADCFAARSRTDLVTDGGEKIVGSAQCRRDGVILQQTSLRIQEPSASLRAHVAASVEEGTYPLAAREDREIRSALIEGFQAGLGIVLEEGGLTAWEEERAAFLAPGLRVS